MLYDVSGVEVTNSVNIKAMFLDMTVDTPARTMWQAIRQYNGYSGCGQCIEMGSTLILVQAKRTPGGDAMSIHLTKHLHQQQDMQDYENMMRSRTKLFKY